MQNSAIYKDYYDAPEIAAWREISAIDKASNVISVWHGLGGAGPSIADIGCGEGAIIRELDRRGFGKSYVGFEISESGVKTAHKNHYTKPCSFILFDGSNVPARDQSFDLAVLSHVLEHVECPRLLLREGARVARYVFVEVPLELNFRTPRAFFHSNIGHINLFNSLLIRNLVQETGMRILAERVKCPSRDVFIFQRPRLLGSLHWSIKASVLKIASTLACHLFTYHYCAIAEATID